MVFLEHKKGMLLKSSIQVLKKAEMLVKAANMPGKGSAVSAAGMKGNEKKSAEMRPDKKEPALHRAGWVIAVWCGDWQEENARLLEAAGADEIFVFEKESLEGYRTERFTRVICQAARECQPELILLGSSPVCNDLAARASVRLGAGLVTDAVAVTCREDGCICLERPDDHCENQMKRFVCRKDRCQMATLKLAKLPEKWEYSGNAAIVRKMEVSEKTESCQAYGKAGGKPEEMAAKALDQDQGSRIIETRETLSEGADITTADCLVSGGRGIRGNQGFALLRELASLLKGEVAASRPNVDEGWIAREHQVGLSGKTVSPKLYLACGISGSVHHRIGMEGSEYVIAINIDRNAPIFDVADLGIVGDVHEILPLLIAYLKADKHSKTIRRMESLEKKP